MARTKEFDPEAAVEAAMHLFWAQGYAATTPADLVEHLGIGRGSLYNTFGSKRGLYERALSHYVEQESAVLDAVLSGPGGARERLRAALDLVVDASVRDRDRRGCMITNATVELSGRDEEVRAVVRRVRDRQETAFRHVILAGQAAGEIDPAVDAADLARFLVTSLNGIRVMARVDRSRRRLQPLADMALRAV